MVLILKKKKTHKKKKKKKKKKKRGSAALMIFNDQIRKAAGFYSVRKILISCKFVSNLALL